MRGIGYYQGASVFRRSRIVTRAHGTLTGYCRAQEHAATHMSAHKVPDALGASGSGNMGGTGVAHSEPPTFELMGFPITSHQVQVLGSAHVRERSRTPTLMLGGMPASPHQVEVLSHQEGVLRQE
jgi:hypothetical protein